MSVQCCCNWGGAGGRDSDEWPEFECADYPVHHSEFEKVHRFKRHAIANSVTPTDEAHKAPGCTCGAAYLSAPEQDCPAHGEDAQHVNLTQPVNGIQETEASHV